MLHLEADLFEEILYGSRYEAAGLPAIMGYINDMKLDFQSDDDFDTFVSPRQAFQNTAGIMICALVEAAGNTKNAADAGCEADMDIKPDQAAACWRRDNALEYEEGTQTPALIS